MAPLVARSLARIKPTRSRAMTLPFDSGGVWSTREHGMWPKVRHIWITLFCAGLSCSRKPPDATPEGAVRHLLEQMARAEANPAETRTVYDLLSSRTKANLVERARRATAATGREMLPHEMLAPARFSLRFDPVHMHARIAADRAVVDVTGIDPRTDHALVPCVLEDERWRVDIPLPPVVPLEHRPEP